jgi:hypothetical protein
MKHSRNLVGAYLSAALLAACGGGNASMSMPALLRHRSSQSETFNYTGGKQKFVVPSYVTGVTITQQGQAAEAAATAAAPTAPAASAAESKRRFPLSPERRWRFTSVAAVTNMAASTAAVAGALRAEVPRT